MLCEPSILYAAQHWLSDMSVLQKVLGLDLKSSAFLSLLPWTVMAVGSSAAGWLADGLVARGWSVTTVRKRLQTVAFIGPAVALTVLSNPATSPTLAVACLTAALGITSLGALQCSVAPLACIPSLL